MSFPGKGNNGDVYSIVSGVLKWAVAAAAGGGVGVTVAGAPVTADYETVTAAVTANETILNVIGDTTEDADTQINSSGLTINIYNDSEINMGANTFLWQQTANVDILGNGRIRYTYSSNDTLFDFNSNSGRVTVDSVEFLNSSSASGTLTNGTGGRFNKCLLTGDLILRGARNSVADSDVTANIIVPFNGINNMVSNTHYGGSLVDNGSGTILSDLLSY